MKVYIAGPIAGHKNYRQKFHEAEKRLRQLGHIPMHSADLPLGFEHHEYLYICDAMIDKCDVILMLEGWGESRGACHEYLYALETGHTAYFRPEDIPDGSGFIRKNLRRRKNEK